MKLIFIFIFQQFGEFNNMTNNGIEVMDHPPVAPMYHFKVSQNNSILLVY